MDESRIDDARRLVRQEAQAREEKCQAEVQKVLDKYSCFLDVSIILKANQTIPRVEVVSKKIAARSGITGVSQ